MCVIVIEGVNERRRKREKYVKMHDCDIERKRKKGKYGSMYDCDRERNRNK